MKLKIAAAYVAALVVLVGAAYFLVVENHALFPSAVNVSGKTISQ